MVARKEMLASLGCLHFSSYAQVYLWVFLAHAHSRKRKSNLCIWNRCDIYFFSCCGATPPPDPVPFPLPSTGRVRMLCVQLFSSFLSLFPSSNIWHVVSPICAAQAPAFSRSARARIRMLRVARYRHNFSPL